MNKKIFCLFLSILLLAVFSSACDENVAINKNDSSLPTIELMVKDGTGKFIEAEDPVFVDPVLGNLETLTFACIATDPHGIKSVELSYSPEYAKYCLVNGVHYSNYFFKLIGLPPAESLYQELAEASTVPTKLPLYINFGPLTCDAGAEGIGVPYKGDISVTCKGKNWATNQQNWNEKTISVKFKAE
jgi:hypothetical protein